MCGCTVGFFLHLVSTFQNDIFKKFQTTLYINHDQKNLCKSYFFMNGLCSNYFISIMRVLVFANMLRCSGPVIHINVYPETFTCTCFTIHIVLSPLGCILCLFTGVAWINYMFPPHVSIPTPPPYSHEFCLQLYVLLFECLKQMLWIQKIISTRVKAQRALFMLS